MNSHKDFIKYCQTCGENRVNSISDIKSPEEWAEKWQNSVHEFPFNFAECWNMTIEYVVDNFEAELGFYIDILGFSVNALDSAYAMVTGPNDDFHISFVPRAPGVTSTPPDAIKLEFMVKNITTLAKELKSRGIEFESEPAPYGGEDSNFITGVYRTPHGIRISLWSMIDK